MAKAQTSFQPVIHGFQFVNHFEIDFPTYTLPLLGKVDLSSVIYGLCGGMCFAALDYFHLKKQPPEVGKVEDLDGRLFAYLCQRQLDSLSIGVLLKIVEWMLLEDDALAARMTRTEIPRLRRSLDQGQPVVLLLIRVQGLGNLTHNHQVAAVGYEASADGKNLDISLYDPNHPGEETHISVTRGKDGLRVSQSSGEPLRGFFLAPYSPNDTLPAIAEADFGALSFASTGFQLQWPTDSRVVNQYFAENPDMYKGFGLAGHEGLDLFALTGANIYACADGEVVEAGSRPKSHPYGVQVRIKHEYGTEKYETVYAHLQEALVKVGQKVKAGERIGLADNTGNSFGSHLHLTLKKEGAKVEGYPAGIIDPWPYLQAASTPVSAPPPSPSGVTVYTFDQTNLRKEASAASELLASLPGGEALAVLGSAADIQPKIGKQDQWLQVQTASGLVGFIAAWLVSSTKQSAFPPSGVVVYAMDTVNMRSGPGTNFELLASLDSTQPLTVLGEAAAVRARVGKQNEWLQVQTQAGQRGFVAAWLVHLTGQVAPAAGLTVYPFEMVNVRARPAVDANILTVAVAGDALTVLGDRAQSMSRIGKQDQWLNIQTPAKVSGYVAAWLVSSSKTKAASSFVTVYANADVNIRAQPSANAPRVTGAVKNEALSVIEADVNGAYRKLGKQDMWIYVQKSDGSRGWAAAWYLSASQS